MLTIQRHNTHSLMWRLIYLRDLLRELVARDIKLRYKRSVLGIAWSLLNPLAQLLVFSFVFQVILPLNIPHYTIFLFTGLLVWNWFQTSLYAATNAIVDNRELIRRPGFPVAVLPVVIIMTNFVHFLLALPILLFFIMMSDIRLTPMVAVLPLVMVVQFVFTMSLAYLTATMQVTFRDTQYLLNIVLLLGFYLSPVFYEASVLPQRYYAVYNLNPMVHLLDAYRAILLAGEPPALGTLAVLGILCCGLLVGGYRIFMHTSYRFAEEL